MFGHARSWVLPGLALAGSFRDATMGYLFWVRARPSVLLLMLLPVVVTVLLLLLPVVVKVTALAARVAPRGKLLTLESEKALRL